MENDKFSEILTYKRTKNSLFECKWGGGRFVGNLKVLSETLEGPPPTGKIPAFQIPNIFNVYT